MRCLLPNVVSSLALLALAAACQAVGSGPPCAAPELYPVCTSARTGLLTCQDGEELVVDCEDGLACLDLVDPASGDRLSACLPFDSIGCDPALFQSACVDPGTLLACVAPPTHPAAGHTERLACAAGETCRLDGDHGACLPDPASADTVSPDGGAPDGGAPAPCDPATFPGDCAHGAPVVCVAGEQVTLAPCLAPRVCRVGPLGAVCADAAAEACDPAADQPTCEGTAVVGCDPGTAFTFRQECPAGQTCRATPEGPVCASDPLGPCDPATFETRCAADGTLIVCTPMGQEVSQTCPGSRDCRVGPNGAFCVQPSAQPCDPATFVPTCAGQFIVTCDPVTAFTDQRPCGRMMHCELGAGGGVCVR